MIPDAAFCIGRWTYTKQGMMKSVGSGAWRLTYNIVDLHDRLQAVRELTPMEILLPEITPWLDSVCTMSFDTQVWKQTIGDSSGQTLHYRGRTII